MTAAAAPEAGRTQRAPPAGAQAREHTDDPSSHQARHGLARSSPAHKLLSPPPESGLQPFPLDAQLHNMCNKVAAGGRNRTRPTIQEPSHDDAHPIP